MIRFAQFTSQGRNFLSLSTYRLNLVSGNQAVFYPLEKVPPVIKIMESKFSREF